MPSSVSLATWEAALCVAAFALGAALGRDSWRASCWAAAAAATAGGLSAQRRSATAALVAGFAIGRRFAVVGLTGGIAAGKSAVSAALARAGAVIVDADAAARKVVEPGAPALSALAARFGPEVLTDNGSLNRAWLRARIAGDAGARAAVNGITHPAIAYEILRAVAWERWFCGRTVVIDAALLFEAGWLYRALCRPVICVVAPDAERVARVQRRDGGSAEQARALISSQMPQDAKAGLADVVLDNGGTFESLAPCADALARKAVSALWWQW